MRRRKRNIVCKVLIALLLAVVMFTSVALSATALKADIAGQSFASLVFEDAMRIFLHKKDTRTEEQTLKLIEDAYKDNESYDVPEVYKSLFDFTTDTYNDSEICYFGDADSEKVFYYIHGGAYIYQPTIVHYMYCAKLAEELDAYVVMPIYPLAPNYTYKTTYAMLYGYYTEELLSDYRAESIVFAGDSAGASLAIGLAQYSVYHGTPSPAAIIAYSPCLDITLSNPDMPQLDASDAMLNRADLSVKFKSYMGEDADPQNYMLSPLYCNYDTLPTVTVFFGTRELLVADGRLLKEKCDKFNIAINYYEFDNMQHTFAILPIPEADRCLQTVKEILHPIEP